VIRIEWKVLPTPHDSSEFIEGPARVRGDDESRSSLLQSSCGSGDSPSAQAAGENQQQEQAAGRKGEGPSPTFTDR